MPLQQNFERVERRLDGRTHSPFFDIGSRDLVALAKFFYKVRRIGLRRIGQEKIVGTGENAIDAGPARLNEQGRGDAAARGHAGVNESLLDVLRLALPRADAGGLLRRV